MLFRSIESKIFLFGLAPLIYSVISYFHESIFGCVKHQGCKFINLAESPSNFYSYLGAYLIIGLTFLCVAACFYIENAYYRRARIVKSIYIYCFLNKSKIYSFLGKNEDSKDVILKGLKKYPRSRILSRRLKAIAKSK